MVGLPDGEKILMMCLFVLIQLTNVTDGQTDRHRMTTKAALDERQKPLPNDKIGAMGNDSGGRQGHAPQ